VRKALHIVTTSFLEGNEVLVSFSDGTQAIYEAEELEKLRPTPKLMLPDRRAHESSTTAADVRLMPGDEELYVA
jgi:hypothetical protein